MKSIRILLALAVAAMTVACYNDFDEPAPAKQWTEDEVAALGLKHMTIKELKDKYIEYFNSLEGTGGNDKHDTKTLKLGAPANPIEGGEVDAFGPFDNVKFWEEGADYYIKGKVISNDEQGNIYKSLHIDDGTAAIELKLCGTLFTTFKLDLETKESMWVYVKLKNMYLGNYRMMLSLGDAPSNGLNTGMRDKYYANSNFESDLLWRNPIDPEFNRVLPGERVKLIDDMSNELTNIVTVTKDDFNKIKGLDGIPYYGRLIRFKGVTVRYANVTYQNEDPESETGWTKDIVAPAFGDKGDPYPNWCVTDSGAPVFGTWYRFGYALRGTSLYGSFLILLNENAKSFADGGAYSVRTSGYSRFAMKPMPKDGAVGDVLGLYTIYSKDLKRGYEQYQISVNRVEDIKFKAEDMLTDKWILHNTPGNDGSNGEKPSGSYAPPVKNGAGEYEE